MSSIEQSLAAPAFAAGAQAAPSPDFEPLQAIQAEFARLLQLGMSAIVHCDVTAAVSGIEQTSYAAFRRALPPGAYQRAISLLPEKGSAILHLSPDLAFPILELMMGASGATSTDLRRPLTALEEDLLETLAQVVLRTQASAWKSIAEIDFRLLPLKSRGADLPLPDQTLILVTVQVEIGKDTKGALKLAFPSSLLRKAGVSSEARSPEPVKAPANEHADLILELIRPAVLEFEARLQGPKVGLRDLMNLKEGQIVLFDNALDGAVDGLLNSTACYRGQVLSDGKHRLLRIDGFIQSETP